MIVTIDIQVTGDHWFNRLEFTEKLQNTDPREIVILNVNTEGPCLSSIGVRSIVDDWLKKHNKSPETVLINNWANGAEQVPYKKLHQNNFSHFFKYSRLYWPADVISSHSEFKLFGLFLGRRTIARNSILYHVANNWSDHFLLSTMKSRNPNPWPLQKEGAVNLEIMDEWINPTDQPKVIEWISQCDIPSVDNKTVQDQYTVPEQSAADCNRSLLTYYNQFKIELVCESYTIGDTFFPTEKTVRPLSAGKPMLIYGPKNFLARLKALGFKTYSDCWSEEYDQLEGPARWQAIRTIIDSLIDLTDAQQTELLKNTQSNALYNRQHLAELTAQ
jgi:hypothetical protein